MSRPTKGGPSPPSTSSATTATAAPGWTAPAWTRFVTTRPGQPSTWCWSPHRTGWPATTYTRWWSWRNWSAAACGWCSSTGPPAMTRCAAGDPDSWCGGRIRADPDRRPHAPRPAGQATQRTAAAVDAGALRLPAAPPAAPGPGLGPDRPGRRRGRAGVIRRLRGRRGDLAHPGSTADQATGADPTGKPGWRANNIPQLLTNPATKGQRPAG